MEKPEQGQRPEPDNRVSIGRRIKRIRQAQDMTLQGLAKKSQMSPGFISEVERGLVAISTPKLMDICKALDVPPSAVLEDENGPPLANTVAIPAALSELADRHDLSHRVVLQLLQGRLSLRARRSQDREEEWGFDEWLHFYNQVREYIDDD
jgi:transcriptional regulator with XRE-family HTH domain